MSCVLAYMELRSNVVSHRHIHHHRSLHPPFSLVYITSHPSHPPHHPAITTPTTPPRYHHPAITTPHARVRSLQHGSHVTPIFRTCASNPFIFNNWIIIIGHTIHYKHVLDGTRYVALVSLIRRYTCMC